MHGEIKHTIRKNIEWSTFWNINHDHSGNVYKYMVKIKEKRQPDKAPLKEYAASISITADETMSWQVWEVYPTSLNWYKWRHAISPHSAKSVSHRCGVTYNGIGCSRHCAAYCRKAYSEFLSAIFSKSGHVPCLFHHFSQVLWFWSWSHPDIYDQVVIFQEPGRKSRFLQYVTSPADVRGMAQLSWIMHERP